MVAVYWPEVQMPHYRLPLGTVFVKLWLRDKPRRSGFLLESGLAMRGVPLYLRAICIGAVHAYCDSQWLTILKPATNHILLTVLNGGANSNYQ